LLQEEVIYKSLRAPKNPVSLHSFVPPRVNVSTELAIQQEKHKEKKLWKQIANVKRNSRNSLMRYHQLNEKTVCDQYPIPLIFNIIDPLQQLKWFTKLDWGYNNIQVKASDEWKVDFITKFSLFKPTVMFFGLCNSPATFQRMMNTN
jgi:hypothetical protein